LSLGADMKYKIEWEPKGTIVTFKGDVDIGDIMDANHVINGDERYYTHLYSIWNFTDCDLSKIQEKDINRPVAMDIGAAHTLDPFKLALIVNNDYSYAISQLYIDKCSTIGLPWKIKIFSNLSDAAKWCST
jgi:hypothetical protein